MWTNQIERKSSLLQIQPPTYGNLITVLSIDGGGIRGLIPATILDFLESQLQVRIILELVCVRARVCFKEYYIILVSGTRLINLETIFLYICRSWMVKRQDLLITLI